MFMSTDISMMDLTGSSVDFKREHIPYRVFKNNQIIELREPAYANSIVVHTHNGTAYQAYSTFTNGAQDDTAISIAKQAKFKKDGGNFTSSLVNSIKITSYSAEVTIYISYQALYKDSMALTGDDIGPVYSPGLMREVLSTLNHLNSVLPPLPDVSGSDLNSIQVLAEDITGTSIDNYIQDEMHLQVNVAGNKFLIRPTNGSFYKHDLVVKHNGVTLVEGTDYEVTGINLGKTKVSLHPSSVYDYIIILKNIAGGVVSLNYRAFGGMICPSTVNQIKITLGNIIDYLKLGNFLTYEGLENHPIILSIVDRIANIENLLHVQAPVTYTYQSSANERWSSIAHISPTTSNGGIVSTIGNSQFRVRCGKYFSELKLNYDLNSTRPLDIHVMNNWSTTVEADGVEYFNKRICPKFRLIWDSTNINAGLVLQMSITSNSSRTLEVTIQNSAGVFSNMKLIPANITLTNDGSSTVLPDGTAWTSAGANSRISNSVIANGRGYTVFMGAIYASIIDIQSYGDIELNDPQDNSYPIQAYKAGMRVPTQIVNSDVDLSEVSAIGFKLYDRHTGAVINKISDDVTMDGNTVVTNTMYFTQDLCLVSCELSRVGSEYSLHLHSHTGSHSLLNDRFILRQVNIYFKGALGYV